MTTPDSAALVARPDIWVHPVTLAQIRQQFTAPAVVGVSVGNVGIYSGSRLFTDCRQVIGTLRDKAMESGEHTCGPDPCGAKQAEASGQECCAAAAPNHTPLCPVAGRYAVKQAEASGAAPTSPHEG